MSLTAKIEAIVLPLLDRYGCDLVEGTFRREKAGLVLRLLIERKDANPDKGSGVDLKLCSSISRDLGTIMDVEETIDRPYTLEVSSAGIERPLVHPEDFKRFAGRPVAVRTKSAVNGRRRFKGVLGGLSDGTVVITNGDGNQYSIPAELVKKANLVFDPKRFEASVGE